MDFKNFIVTQLNKEDARTASLIFWLELNQHYFPYSQGKYDFEFLQNLSTTSRFASSAVSANHLPFQRLKSITVVQN
jgi:hypothetical protein